MYIRGITFRFQEASKIFALTIAAVFLCGLIWPRPPESAKIEYLYSFSKPEDLKITKKSGEKLFELVFGKSKTDVDELVRPQGVFAADGIILVSDTFLGCVHVFNQKENSYFKIKGLISPVSCALSPDHKIYAADSKTGKVFVYDLSGKLLKEFGRFKRPSGIAVDRSSGDVYVVDTLDNSVNVFSPDGVPISKLKLDKDKSQIFNHPTYISLDGFGGAYVVDSLNFKVREIGPDFEQKLSFGKMGRSPGSFSLPKGIAVDSNRNIYVSDASFDNIQIFNQKGKLLLFFGESGNKEGEFWIPAGISIDENDKIYVADSYNSRVQVFQYLK